MADERVAENTISSSSHGQSATVGDVPEAIRRRYYTDERGGPGLGFYVDATITRAAFRDRGGQLSLDRADPNAIRDAAEIAKHRGWTIVTARGSAEFRREAWLAGRALGLEVRGYRATERDLQELERRTARQERREHRQVESAARSQLRIVDAVVRARVDDPGSQQRIMDAARTRIADWLDRGARFEPRPSERTNAAERNRVR
jgi:hypothetical protein